MSKALISIKPEHVKNILSGRKTVELRTRSINLPVGTRLWIYSTLPIGEVEIVVKIKFIETRPPSSIWRKYRNQLCITKSAFNAYTESREEVTVIGLAEVKEMEESVSLSDLRGFDEKFTPPQFFLKLTPDKKISQAFS